VGPAVLLLGLLRAGERGRPGPTAVLAEAGCGLAIAGWAGWGWLRPLGQAGGGQSLPMAGYGQPE